MPLHFWLVTLDRGDTTSWDCRRRSWIQSRTCQGQGAAKTCFGSLACEPGDSNPTCSCCPLGQGPLAQGAPTQPGPTDPSPAPALLLPLPQPGPLQECVFNSSVETYNHSSCFWNKPPQTQWLKITQIYFPIVLHGQVPNTPHWLIQVDPHCLPSENVSSPCPSPEGCPHAHSVLAPTQ